jgi:hypothetical protein
MLRSLSALAATLLLASPIARANAQHCVASGGATLPVVRAAAGLEWGGDGSARGAAVSLHGRRWFVAGEFGDRSWAFGRRRFSGLPVPGFMERQHQVLGVRAGGRHELTARSALCVSGGYARGTGLGYQLSGDPLLGGVGFETHTRVRGDVELAHDLTIGAVRIQPAASIGLLFVHERELQGDIVEEGLTGYLPITLTLGVPLGDVLTVRPRLNLPRGGSRGSSYGVDAMVQIGRLR